MHEDMEYRKDILQVFPVTQGERVEREVGGEIGMGNTCKPMAVLFQCMTKFTTNKKKKRKKKEKIFSLVIARK